MKTTRTQSLIAAVLVGGLEFGTIGAQTKNINTRIGELSFTHDFADGTLPSPRNSKPLSGPTQTS